jgi:hypothetical protein
VFWKEVGIVQSAVLYLREGVAASFSKVISWNPSLAASDEQILLMWKCETQELHLASENKIENHGFGNFLICYHPLLRSFYSFSLGEMG